MDFNHFFNIEVIPSGEQDWIFHERESNSHHTPYDWEKLVFNCIREGDVQLLERIIGLSLDKGLKVGKLSKNEVRQAQYLAVAMETLATRTAIDAGMLEADAYNRSDIFIQKIDKLTSVEEILKAIITSFYEWTEEVHRIRFQGNYSAPVRTCVEYIYINLHSKITLDDLSREACLSKPYLSKIFKEEVGINISGYILRQKVESAKNMLRYSKLSEKDIGNYLNFSSQSYFINCFKKQCGVTPRQYKMQLNKA
jgi:YesN/AraC family two-component response regulator